MPNRMVWGVSAQPSPQVVGFSWLGFRILPSMLLVMHCFAATRFGRVSWLASLAVVAVPLFVEQTAGMLMEKGAQKLLPPPPAQEKP